MSKIRITPKSNFDDKSKSVSTEASIEDPDATHAISVIPEMQKKYEQLKYQIYKDEQEFKNKYRKKIPRYIWYLVWFLVFVFFIILPLSTMSGMDYSCWSGLDWVMSYVGALGSVIEPAGIALLAAVAGKIISLLLKVFKRYINDNDV